MKLAGLSGNQYYIRVSAVSQDVALSHGGNIPFQEHLTVIDATGKAQDVLRRVQVYVPLNGSSQNQVSDFALESTDSICKRFSVMPGLYQSNIPFNMSASNPLCQP